ncbi:MAG: helix-turn-helix domain-containing protein [Phycisphaerales bacterium]|nr:MAG: helix-turn-helix domain-containing protein [Phycisphaerales bacterium]
MSSVPAILPVPVVMTTAEAAQLLRCEPATVTRYVHSHELNAIKIGRERRIRGDDLLDFLKNRPVVNGGRR